MNKNQYNKKHVEIGDVDHLSHNELCEVVQQIMDIMQKSLVKIAYFSHGEESVQRLLVCNLDEIELGTFDSDGNKIDF